MGHLIGALVRAWPAERRHERVKPRDHISRRRARHQPDDGVVERPRQIECRRELVVGHPQHTKPAIVGKQAARADGVDEFRRQRDADDGQRAAAGVDDGGERRARPYAMRHRKGLGDDDFQPAPRELPATLDHDIVQDRPPSDRQRYHARRYRLGDAGHVDEDLADDAGLDGGDAGDVTEAAGERERRALQRHEHVGEALLFVELRPGLRQRHQVALPQHRHGDPCGHHTGNRRRLALQPEEVAEELVGQRSHGLTIAARARRPSWRCGEWP